MRLALIVALQCAALISCGGGAADRCEVNADCPSGFCRADGTCAPDEGDGDAGAPDADQLDASGTGCQPNHDGTIARDEISLAPGRTATFRVALDATVDTAGTMDANGMRTWDLSGALAGDLDETVELIDPSDQWWANLYPRATYAVSLSAESELLGVFELTDTQLKLLGVVSPTGGNTRTQLAYSPPAIVLQFPLTPSAAWSVDSSVGGYAQGVWTVYSEAYDYRVDAVGDLDTPFGEFPVSRVAVDLSRNVGGFLTTRRSFAFVAECYATVATIVSQDYEAGSEFTDAAEVRRLAP